MRALRRPAAVVADARRERLARHVGLVLDELNVKRIRYVSEAEELGRWELRPNYRALGPRFGKQMPQVVEAVAALDAQSAAARLRAGAPVGVSIGGSEHELAPDDLQLVLLPVEGYQLERAGTHAVALDLRLDAGLWREGLAREVVHSVQAARKAAGLEVSDSIVLTLAGDSELIDVAREHERYVAGETLASRVGYDGARAPERPHAAQIDGRELLIGVERA